MKALSIRQPWAWLICAGYKDIENRGWATSFRGRFYVHAGKRSDLTEGSIMFLKDAVKKTGKFWPTGPLWRDVLRFGAIIGEVDIVDCVTESPSPWFVGPYGFVLANPRAYDTPIPCRGQLGFFVPAILQERK